MMNEDIILNMAQPYVKDSAITYNEFENIYSVLSLKEQYEVIEILFSKGIDLVDKQVDEDSIVLDIENLGNADEDFDDDNFEVLYDEELFKDSGTHEDAEVPLLFDKNIKQSNEILCKLIQDNNRQAMQDLCIKNRRLVGQIAADCQKRFNSRLEFEDLEQVGFMGLIKAAQKFDLHMGTAFSTYAVYWIKQSIVRELMDNGYIIRIPVHMMEKIIKVSAMDSRLVSQNIPLTERIRTIAGELDESEDMINRCLILKRDYLKYTSLDIPIGEEQETPLGDFVPIEEEEGVEKIVEMNALRDSLNEAMGRLTERERDILKLRFGMDCIKNYTLEEIGEMYGVTRERIRQIEEKALRKLRLSHDAKSLRYFLED